MASTSSPGWSKNRAFSQCRPSQGLKVRVVCLNKGGSTRPRGAERSSLSNSSSAAISYASSTQTQQSVPVSTVVEASFSALSNPRNRIRCPVGLYQSISGSSDAPHRCSTPSRRMAHRSWAKVLSRWVRCTARTTSRLAPGSRIR